MLQCEFHQLIGNEPPSGRTQLAQIDNGFHPTVLVEAARSFDLGNAATVRTSIAGQAGIEMMMRIGADFTFGSIGLGEFLVRNSTSGHRYRVIQNVKITEFSFIAGADIAYVS
jgi:hypothetical protein